MDGSTTAGRGSRPTAGTWPSSGVSPTTRTHRPPSSCPPGARCHPGGPPQRTDRSARWPGRPTADDSLHGRRSTRRASWSDASRSIGGPRHRDSRHASPRPVARAPAGSPGPIGAWTAPVISIAGRTCSWSTRDRALGRGRSREATGASRTSSGTPDSRTVALHVGPRAGRRPAPAHDDLGRSMSTGATAEPIEVLAPPVGRNHPAPSPDGRWLAAIGILEARSARRRQPRPARWDRPTARARRRRSPRTWIGRSATGSTPTSTAGWSRRAPALPGSTNVRSWRSCRTAVDRCPSGSGWTPRPGRRSDPPGRPRRRRPMVGRDEPLARGGVARMAARSPSSARSGRGRWSCMTLRRGRAASGIG